MARSSLIVVVACALLASLVPAASAAYATDVRRTAGLLSYWRLGETSGTTVKDETSRYPGRFRGAVTLRRPGAITGDANGATALDGVGEYAEMAASPALGSSFTVEAWVRPSRLRSGMGPIVSKQSGASGYFLYTLTDRTLVFGTGSGGHYPYVTAPALAPGRWHHIVATVADRKLSLYVDGALAGSQQYAIEVAPSANDVPLRIGAHAYGSAPSFDGTIDDVALYGRALGAAEVEAHWRAAGSGAGNGAAVDPAPADPAQFFGFTDNAVTESQISAARDAELTAPQGADAVRITFSWRWHERTRGNVDWSKFDAIYTEMMARGIRPIWTILGAPEWAWEAGRTCPAGNCWWPVARENYGDLRRIATQLVQRYPRTAAIEFWNEPNHGWNDQPALDPARYTEMLGEVHAAVKAAAPEVPVLGGVLSGNQVTDALNISLTDYLSAMYQAGAKGKMDGLAVHAYPCRICAPFDLYYQRLKIQQARDVRDAHGDAATPLWITESGVSASGPSRLTEEQQATHLVETYRALKAEPGVKAIMLYTLLDPEGVDAATNIEGGYGILRADGSQKPAYCALARERGVVSTACPSLSSTSQTKPRK
jgi:hypothetical protein